MKPSELSIYLEFAIVHTFNVLIVSKPGTGKTEITKNACEAFRNGNSLAVFLWHPVVHDPTNYKGLPFPDNTHTFTKWLPYGGIWDLINAKEDYIVVIIDDLGQAIDAVQKPLMQLLLEKQIDGLLIPNRVVFIALTNRREDKAGVQGILEPVKSRFKGGIIHLEVDTEDWVKWAIINQMPTVLTAFIRFRPELLDNFKPTKDMVNSPCPRTVAAVGETYNKGIPAGLEFEVFSGIAGKGFASEFMAFLDMYRTLPDIKFVLMNPKSADVPTEPSTLYAVCGALAENASENNFDNVVEYTNRLPSEFQVLLIKDATNRKKELVNTNAFIKWTSDHSDVLI
uniref:Putative ATPase domain containing protein n=1 Tax=viral metagenome TaxID=1070528 RepID=A0A6H1ZC27_9ZZZZ